jgi:hypothetical protein
MTDQPWGDEDRAAIRDLTEQHRAEDPDAALSTLKNRARASHFARTGRVPAHNVTGYKAGCRCATCRATQSASFGKWRAQRRQNSGRS